VLDARYEVMDMTAFTLCQENNMPIMVVDFWSEDSLYRAVHGNHEFGTIIS
jgi:uridylate kinase